MVGVVRVITVDDRTILVVRICRAPGRSVGERAGGYEAALFELEPLDPGELVTVDPKAVQFGRARGEGIVARVWAGADGRHMG